MFVTRDDICQCLLVIAPEDRELFRTRYAPNIAFMDVQVVDGGAERFESVANALEPLRTAQDVNLNGESADLAAQAPAGGVLKGFQVLTLRIEPGGSLN